MSASSPSPAISREMWSYGIASEDRARRAAPGDDAIPAFETVAASR